MMKMMTRRMTMTLPPTGSTDYQGYKVLPSFSLLIIKTKNAQMASVCKTQPCGLPLKHAGMVTFPEKADFRGIKPFLTQPSS